MVGALEAGLSGSGKTLRGLGPEIAVNANENGGFVACQQDIGELAHG